MIVKNQKLLDEHKQVGRCLWCNRYFSSLDPAHIFARGMGGGGRLDLRINVCSLCRECHTFHHSGHEPTRESLLAMVAKREACLQDDVERVIHLYLRLPKGITDEWAREVFAMELSNRSLAIALREWEEWQESLKEKT